MQPMDCDVVVIGGGAGGLTAAGVTAAFGARTLLIERHRLGGDCTWTGCVPSKALLSVARDVHRARNLSQAGMLAGELQVNFEEVLRTVRGIRRHVYYEADSPEVLARRGVEALSGNARFEDEHRLRVTTDTGERTVTFRRAVVATGASPAVPDIPGLAEAGYLTNESIFELEHAPQSLAVLGGGPVGVEIAQAFRRLGTQVYLISRGPRVLEKDDPVCAAVVQEQLGAEGVSFHLEQTLTRVDRRHGSLELTLSGPESALTVEALLVAVGRRPNLDGLESARAGVSPTSEGLAVDAHCRTSSRHIFAVGDVTDRPKFTHLAENMGKTAGLNAVFGLPLFRHERRVVPWVTYTDPECAHVGATLEELKQAGRDFDLIEFPYGKIDRAVAERSETGVVRVYRRGKTVLGMSAAGAHAGELVAEYALALRRGLGLDELADTVHAYPTYLLGARRAADQYHVRRARRWMLELVRRVYRYRGKIPDYVGTREIV